MNYNWKAAKNYSRFFFRFINCNRVIKTLEHQKILNLLNEACDCKSFKYKAKLLRNTEADGANRIFKTHKDCCVSK